MSGTGRALRWGFAVAAVSLATLCGGAALAGTRAGEPTNLLVNPGAETGSLSPWSISVRAWSVGTYGPGTVAPPGRGDGGSHLFAPSGTAPVLEQDVDVSSQAAKIDAGQAELTYGGYFGGVGQRTDSSGLRIEALDATGGPLGLLAEVGDPTPGDRRGTDVMVACVLDATLPLGTRRLRATLTARGAQDDTGYADELFATLDPVAAPARRRDAGEGPGCDPAEPPTTTATTTVAASSTTPPPDVAAPPSTVATPPPIGTSAKPRGTFRLSLRHRRPLRLEVTVAASASTRARLDVTLLAGRRRLAERTLSVRVRGAPRAVRARLRAAGIRAARRSHAPLRVRIRAHATGFATKTRTYAVARP